MQIKQPDSIVFITVIFLMLLSSMDTYLDGLRYVKYITPVVVILYWVTRRRFELYPSNESKPFIFLILISVLLSFRGNEYGLQDIVFMVSGVAPFVLVKNRKINVSNVFYVTILFFIIITLPIVLKNGVSVSFINSKSTLENHTFGFLFGLFCCYFFCVKDKKMFFIALLFSILTLKRISIIAVILVVAASYLPIITRVLTKPYFMVFLNGLYVFIAFFITTALFNDLCVEYIGLGASYITMGRDILYGGLFEEMDLSVLYLLGGVGIGESYSVAAHAIEFEGKYNLHSDVLKIYFELGALAFVTFFWLLYKERNGVLMALYLNIVLFTDNVSTYSIVLFYYLMLAEQMRLNGFGEFFNKDKNA